MTWWQENCNKMQSFQNGLVCLSKPIWHGQSVSLKVNQVNTDRWIRTSVLDHFNYILNYQLTHLVFLIMLINKSFKQALITFGTEWHLKHQMWNSNESRENGHGMERNALLWECVSSRMKVLFSDFSLSFLFQCGLNSRSQQPKMSSPLKIYLKRKKLARCF